MTAKKYSDLFSRTLAHCVSSFIFVLLILFSVLCPFRPLFTLIMAIIALVALCEFYGLVKKKGISPAIVISCFFSFFFFYAILLKLHPEIVLGMCFIGLFIYYALKKEALLGLSSTLFGILYVIIPFGCLVYIGTQIKAPSNGFWLAYLILVTKSSDLGGYFVGRAFGRHRFAKTLSPNKTIEGAVGGIVAALVMSFILVAIEKRYLHLLKDFSYFLSTIVAAILAIFAMLGDLAESLLKRDAKVKDSNVIPGIGGILDVVDALLFTSPFLYFFLKIYYIPHL